MLITHPRCAHKSTKSHQSNLRQHGLSLRTRMPKRDGHHRAYIYPTLTAVRPGTLAMLHQEQQSCSPADAAQAASWRVGPGATSARSCVVASSTASMQVRYARHPEPECTLCILAGSPNNRQATQRNYCSCEAAVKRQQQKMLPKMRRPARALATACCLAMP